jgi:hypothetical protein
VSDKREQRAQVDGKQSINEERKAKDRDVDQVYMSLVVMRSESFCLWTGSCGVWYIVTTTRRAVPI